MIGGKNGDPQNISERKEQEEVKSGQPLLSGSLFELQIGSSKEEILENFFETVERIDHLLSLAPFD